MPKMPETWDYLIITAANDRQAAAYDAQIRLRRQLGLILQVREVLVVPDFEGRRIGSGGSTVHCLERVVNRELVEGARVFDFDSAEAVLRGLRILIVHAGGDSRRLPAYSPCGKIFVPLPGESHSALAPTLFDRLVQLFLDLPSGPRGEGQVAVASGDALIRFDTSSLDFSRAGMTVLGSYTSPGEAARHGVFCPDRNGSVRLYLQKPSVHEQVAARAIDRYGRSVLDIGIMSFDAGTAAQLLRAFSAANTAAPDSSKVLTWTPAVRQAIISHGIDLYREICCALGTEATLEHYIKTARSSGSTLEEDLLADLFPALRSIPLNLQVVPECSFLHFGSTHQLIASGIGLFTQDTGAPPTASTLAVNSEIHANGGIAGIDSWVEGCRLRAPLTLRGRNVVAGVDVSEPLALSEGACLDVSAGSDRTGDIVWFIRCYGIGDTFKDSVGAGATFCGKSLRDWLRAVGASVSDIWSDESPMRERTLWNARVFPAEEEHEAFRRWLWMFDVDNATPEQKNTFLSADRYSCSEMAVRVDQSAFHARRSAIRAAEIQRSLRRMFSARSRFSARDLAFALGNCDNPALLAANLLEVALEHLEARDLGVLDSFVYCRIIHSLGSAIDALSGTSGAELEALVPRLAKALPDSTLAWAKSVSLPMQLGNTAHEWASRMRALAFGQLTESIVSSSLYSGEIPRNAMRPDETIWGRSPARIELGGGWTDTPPYTLEHGGKVINTAVNLNGQPPIHSYGRVVAEPVIRLSSIDGGKHIEISNLAELLDYQRPGDQFALVKAALSISGFSPKTSDWPEGITLRQMLQTFGGGIELTTLVGIPQGSGLGTSSILGAVVLAVIHRMMGRDPSQQELFHDVLRLEQALTTGGGWQDQIGGCVGGTKITTTQPGLFPDARIQYVPDDVLDPKLNGGSTLLYYTGLTRLAKNILQEIVGGYLNRDRAVMAALVEEHLVAQAIADAMSRKDTEAFGHYVDAAWALQKRLCSTVTSGPIESLLGRVRPHVHGMRISGAGGGGFLLMICKSPRDASQVRQMLEREPLNDRSRFFDFAVNHFGLEVTTC